MSGRVINFGEKKEAMKRMVAAVEERGPIEEADEQLLRSLILSVLREEARKCAPEFDLYENEAKEAFAKEALGLIAQNHPRAAEIFSDTERDLIERAFFLTMESEQTWRVLKEQKFR